MRRAPASDDERRPLAPAAIDETADTVKLPLGDQRAHFGLPVERIANAHRIEGGGERAGNLITTRARHEDAAESSALLTAEADQIGHDAGNDGFYFGVVEDDGGGFSSKFESAPRHPAAADRSDMQARGCGAGEADLIDLRF